MPVDRQILAFNSYRKKPVVIQAAQLTVDAWTELYELPDKTMTIGKYHITAVKPIVGPKHFLVETLEGTMRGELNDYLLIGVKGEIYPCKEAIFKETYENANLGIKIEPVPLPEVVE